MGRVGDVVSILSANMSQSKDQPGAGGFIQICITKYDEDRL